MKNLKNFNRIKHISLDEKLNQINGKADLLGQMLVKKNVIDERQLEIALETSDKTNEYLGKTIVDLGFADENKVFEVVSEQLKIPYVQIKNFEIPKELISKVQAKIAYYYQTIPLKFKDNILEIAMINPCSIRAIDEIKLFLGSKVRPLLAGHRDMEEAFKKYYGLGAETIENMLKDEPAPKENTDTQQKEKIGFSIDQSNAVLVGASVAKLVDQIFMQALNDNATDIHLEPYRNDYRLRYRIDGELYDIKMANNFKKFQEAIINRIKIMANLDISQKRLPQDGRILINANNLPVDLRVSILPTPWGEAIEIRILQHKMNLALETLGLSSEDFKKINKLINKPHGIVLLTGPTGSGKTTALYSFLNKIKSPQKKIITIEDPIEYEIEQAMQMQANPNIGFGFANALRSMLRHDPDILMVGEIRDAETAQIATRLAITGHLVFSTLHTNSAISSVARLSDMGIEPYLIASSLEGVIAVRLVRKICQHCKITYRPSRELAETFGLKPFEKLHKGKGCSHCHQSGYKGRTAVFEILTIDNKIKEMIVNKAPTESIKKYATEKGFKTLKSDGLEKAKAGVTTVEEIYKATE